MTFGSLFAGIGGFDLGLERTGMICKWQVEIDPYARRVLARHWPDVRRWDDVRTFPPDGEWGVDLICGGFPCQDLSIARQSGAGLDGKRSGLWFEFLRILRILRPRFAIIENVAVLTIRGLGTVLSGLAALGFDAEWSVLPACALGAPHSRERLFIVAYANEIRWRSRFDLESQHGLCRRQWNGKATADSSQWRDVQRWLGETFQNGDWESSETTIHRMADGVPAWMDRNGLVGNAIVPAVAEWIGNRIMESQHAGPVPSSR